jgi:cytoskeletal protein CcmA (bactofilin family)
MLFGKKGNGDKHISSLVGAGSTLVGDLMFSGGLRIDGTVRGSVRCAGGEGTGMLVVSEQGSVEGEVRAAHLVVAGRITGPVHATELVELQPKARINGDVHYRAIEMHHGAIVDGRLVHESGAQSLEVRNNVKLAIAASNAAPKTESPRG